MGEPTNRLRDAYIPALTDDDVYAAMGRLPGYLDITADDFRDLYRLAYDNALSRLMGGLKARDLMRAEHVAAKPEWPLKKAAELMSLHQIKSLPVTYDRDVVVGMLSESDILRRLGASICSDLILQGPDRVDRCDGLLNDTAVKEAMTSPAVTVSIDADYELMLRAFHAHGGRRMAVVDARGRLLGVLVRKDFLAACPFGPR